MKVVTVRVSDGLLERVDGAAEAFGIDRSEWVRLVLALASGYESRVARVADVLRMAEAEARRRRGKAAKAPAAEPSAVLP